MPSLHPTFETNYLSDHIKQIADFTFNGTKIRVVTHNMLNRCTKGEYTDNAWNIAENNEQYLARLELMAKQYQQDAMKGATIIGLQEAPRAELAEQFFKFMELGSSWKYVVRNTANSDEQALMFIYNEAVTGPIKEAKYELNERACSYSFIINGQNVEFINIHAHYTETFDYNLAATKVKMAELMKTEGKDIKIRFGDHNANQNRYQDLLVWQDNLPTSTAFDKKTNSFSFTDERDGNTYKNYDGFAVSANYLAHGHSYTLHPSPVMSPALSNNGNLKVINTPEIPSLTECVGTEILGKQPISAEHYLA